MDDSAKKLQVRNVSHRSKPIFSSPPFRNSSDDGILSGLILGPLVSSSLLYIALSPFSQSPDADVLNSSWYIEPPQILANFGNPYTPLEALVLSRRSAVDLATLCSVILLTHVCTSKWAENRHQPRASGLEGERASVPRSEGRKFWLYVLMTSTVCCSLLVLRGILEWAQIGLWQSTYAFRVLCSTAC